MSHYRIEVVESLREWERLSSAWNDALAKSSVNTVFLSWEWLFSWAESYLNGRRKLFILAVFNRDELVGIAPWYIHSVPLKPLSLKQIEFLGAPEAGSDYLDVIIKKGKEKEVAFRIYQFLYRETPVLWDRIVLRDLPANSLFLLHLLNQIEAEGKYAEIRACSFCPFVSLSGNGGDPSLRLSPHRRQRFNRDLKILLKGGGAQHRHFSLRDDVDAAVEDFFSFYKEKKGAHEEHLRIFVKRYISRCAGKDTVEIDMLTADGNIIAGLLHLRYQDTLSLYLMATEKDFNNKISVGNILVGLSIERAGRLGFSTYDFLKGSEQYKFHWASGGRSSISLSLSRKKIAPVLYIMKDFLKYTAKVILR